MQTRAYVDEHFHLQITENYLADFDFVHYHLGITTPPGLYFMGFIFGILIQPIHLVLTGSWIKYQGPNFGEMRDIDGGYQPTPGMLNIRYLNSVALPMICYYLVYNIFKNKGSHFPL